ncbi:hypothetical protein Tco_0374139 [Tanacetum coccineum]
MESCKLRENLNGKLYSLLKEYDHIPPKEKCMALLLAERFLKLKQAVEEEQNQPEVMQELLLKLMNDLQILNGIQPKKEEPVAQSFLLNWNIPMVDDDGINYYKSSVENLVPISSESKGISDDICDVPIYDNDHFDAEFGLIDYLLSRDISNTFPKIDLLPEEFAEEREIDIDILQIEDEILREKLLNVNLLIDKIEALNLTPFTPFVLEYSSSFTYLVVDSDFLIEVDDTFLVPKDSIPLGIESDFD